MQLISQLTYKILFTTGKLNTVLLRNLHRNDLMFLLFWTYLQKGFLCVLAINNPNIQNVSAHAHTDKMAACFKNTIYSTVSFIALSLIIAESAFSCIFFLLSFCLHLVLLLRDTAFHLNNFRPAFILVCVLVVLYVLQIENINLPLIQSHLSLCFNSQL